MAETTMERRVFVEEGEMTREGDAIGGEGSMDAWSRRFVYERTNGRLDVITIYAYAVDLWERYAIDEGNSLVSSQWGAEIVTIVEEFESREAYESDEYPICECGIEYEPVETDIYPQSEDEAQELAKSALASIRADRLG